MLVPLRVCVARSGSTMLNDISGECARAGESGYSRQSFTADRDVRSSVRKPVSAYSCRMDLEVSPSLTIPAQELQWRFSRSSGPGGQHVNTSSSRVQLTWSVTDSIVLSDDQRAMLLTRLGRRMIAGGITVTVQEQRSQLRNRESALESLAEMVRAALAPPGPIRRATRPTKGSARRHLAAKKQRSETKQQRQRPTGD